MALCQRLAAVVWSLGSGENTSDSILTDRQTQSDNVTARQRYSQTDKTDTGVLDLVPK